MPNVCYQKKCVDYAPLKPQGCNCHELPSSELCSDYKRNPPRPRKGKSDLIKCASCGRMPETTKSKHNTLEKTIFNVSCKNPKYKGQPSTEDCLTLSKAKKMWNGGCVTNRLPF